MSVASRRLVFIGSKPLGLAVAKKLNALAPGCIESMVTIDDSGDPRSCLPEFLALAQSSGIPLFVAKNRREADEAILRAESTTGLVVGWYWLFDERVIGKFADSLIGVHNSLLPRLRGGSPLVWSIINGDETVGYSVFSIGKEMDAGDIWWQQSFRNGPDDTVADLLQRIETGLLESLDANLRGLLSGAISPSAQDHSQATYCAMRAPEDGRINWTWPARKVHDFVRAQSAPYPGAFFGHQGGNITVCKGSPEDPVFFGTPGQVARVDARGALVCCGDSTVYRLEVVARDGVEKPAQEVLSSIRIRLGPGT